MISREHSFAVIGLSAFRIEDEREDDSCEEPFPESTEMDDSTFNVFELAAELSVELVGTLSVEDFFILKEDLARLPRFFLILLLILPKDWKGF